jgi:hypothetical protein
MDRGLAKRHAPEDRAEGLHGMATTALPPRSSIEAKDFVALPSAWEMGLGGALLAPFVPTWVGGLGLVAFSSGLPRLYLKDPGSASRAACARAARARGSPRIRGCSPSVSRS